MGRYRKYQFEEEDKLQGKDLKFIEAYKRVKRIKGFYLHACIYVLVNIFLIATNFKWNSEFWHWQTFSTATLWGVGLAVQGFSVFGKNIFFGKEWEERKIREIMDQGNNKKWE